MFMLLYGISIRATYRSVFVSPIDTYGIQVFSWKKFLRASAIGGTLIATSLLIWLLTAFIEYIFYEYEGGRDPQTGTTLLLLLIVPLGLWAGGVYSHLTRFQSGKLSRTKRSLFGFLAGLLGGSVGSVLAFVVLSLFWETYFSFEDYAIVGGVVGLVTGFMSVLGAVLYIFWLYPWSLRRQRRKQKLQPKTTSKSGLQSEETLTGTDSSTELPTMDPAFQANETSSVVEKTDKESNDIDLVVKKNRRKPWIILSVALIIFGTLCCGILYVYLSF
jgi:MFS family permease